MDYRYLCEQCMKAYVDGVDCPDCEDEPLLDLRDEGTVQYLQDRDDADRTEKSKRFTYLAMALCVPALGLMFVDFAPPRPGARGGSPFLIALGVYGICVAGLSRLLLSIFPARRRVPPGGF